ncbi:MFS transporter [Robiginitalea sediminis]|uniref:MFS transporter n=1 Tax=Robiginitalea sediminis TaxID=1982593 RepID=UPI000B4B6C98|nr:MFS transporter [Robiginitalea sediminis]
MEKNRRIPWYYLALLILAGEAVFVLPFVLPRVFRPTVLDAFGLDNLELGICFSIYGFVAMGSYLLGGPLADRLDPRKLIALALWLTALGGLVLATFPSYSLLKILYGYWGMTTIFLFWAPMIKATRIWGGSASQGKAFGFLDGGRGLVAALFGSLGVFLLSTFMETNAATQGVQTAFRTVILVSSGLVAVVGILVWWGLRHPQDTGEATQMERMRLNHLREVLRLRSVWLLMAIILCAYVGYKITDIFSLYAQEVMGYDPVGAARVGTFLLFLRPVVGVVIGVLADRTATSKVLLAGFWLSVAGGLLFASGLMQPSFTILFFLSILVVAGGVYATRSLYFAVMNSGRIPLRYTGTAVGLVSLTGFTPDIFAGPVIGYLLEAHPGREGHQHVFWMLVGFSLLGAWAASAYLRRYGKS